MALLGLALASTLALSPPPDADVIVVAPPPPAAPAPAPDWGPSSTVAVSVAASAPPPPLAPPRPSVPSKPSMGVGLYISSAVAFTIGLSARLGQVDTAVRHCGKFKGGTSMSAHSPITACFDSYDPPGLDENDIMVGISYGTSMVLNMIASGALGRYKAWQTVFGDGRARNPNSRRAAGAIFTGLGIGAIGAHYAMIYANSRNPCGSWECNVQRRAMWIAASDGGALFMNVGLGLFSWSGNYRSNLDSYRRRAQWTLLPGAGGSGSVGATASVRF